MGNGEFLEFLESWLGFMVVATIRAAERWRAIRVSEIEPRQMRAVRDEPDREYEAPNGLDANTTAPAHHARVFSFSWTRPRAMPVVRESIDRFGPRSLGFGAPPDRSPDGSASNNG